MIEKCRDLQGARPMFDGWQETLIWSCIQNIMGDVFVKAADAAGCAGRITAKNPESAAAIIGDFTFFAGTPDRELAAFWPETCRHDFRIMVPQHDGWAAQIEACYGARARRTVRYAIKKEPDVFSRETLKKMAESLGDEYDIRMIDEELYEKCLNEEWSRDLVSQFGSYERYKRLGLGVAAVKDGFPVSGASSYTVYHGGIEIEIDTKEPYRRRGLALACGARLILECLERGLYPSWDAQNLWSVALAEKLGYHFDHEYTVYEVTGQEET